MEDSPSRTRQVGTAAVTGASGYVGSRLCEGLADRGWAVHGMVRRSNTAPSCTGGSIPFTLGEGLDPGLLRGKDVLVHCAYDFRPIKWEEIRRVNVEGSIQLFEAAMRAGVGRIVLISTMSAFDGCASLYGRAKLEIERAATGLGAAIVRPGLVYGREAEGMVGALDRFIRVSRVAPLFGGGKQILYLAHQADLADLVAELCQAPDVPREPVVAACEKGMTFKEILQVLARAQKKSMLLIPAPWRLAWLMLRAGEIIGIQTRLKSDSLVSLLNQNQHPDFGPTQRLGVRFRDFRTWMGE